MKYSRQDLSKWQTELRQIMESFQDHEKAMILFLAQHARLHSEKVSRIQSWSYEDKILNKISEERFRHISPKNGHSVAWCIWHIARIEDVTMNLLVADDPQILSQGDWLAEMNISYRDTGNTISDDDMSQLSTSIDLQALRAYRLAIGRKTRQIVRGLAPDDLKQKVAESRLRRVMDEGALHPDAVGIYEYWRKRTIAGLLLMPPTRHTLVHLNEAAQLAGLEKE